MSRLTDGFKIWMLRRRLLGRRAKGREAAAEKLESLGWRPQSAEEKAAVLVAQGEWEDAAKLGAPAARFLGETMVTARPYACVEIAEALASIGSPEAVGHLLRTIERGDAWVTMGDVLAYEGTKRGLAHSPLTSGISDILQNSYGVVHVEIRKACEAALVSIARSGVDISNAVSRATRSKTPWVQESASRVLQQLKQLKQPQSRGVGKKFRFHCPHCKQSLKASYQQLGRKVVCPHCRGNLRLPDKGPSKAKSDDSATQS